LNGPQAKEGFCKVKLMLEFTGDFFQNLDGSPHHFGADSITREECNLGVHHQSLLNVGLVSLIVVQVGRLFDVQIATKAASGIWSAPSIDLLAVIPA
jgi:hypothetical protein